MHRFLPVVSTIALAAAACGEPRRPGSGGDEPPADGGTPGGSGVGEVQPGEFTPDTAGVTPEIHVDLPQGVRAVIVIAHGREGSMYQLRDLVAPDGFALNGESVCDMSIFGNFNGPNRTVQAESVGAWLVPDADPSVVAPHVGAGTWKFRVEGMKPEGMSGSPDRTPVRVEVIYRRGEIPAAGTLDLNLFFTGAGGVTAANAATTQKIQDALAKMRAHFAQAGVTIGAVSYFDAPSDLQVLNTIMGEGSDYSRLLKGSAGKPEAVNLFLVQEIKSPLGGGGTILGMAGGIPGPYLRQGTARSGIAIVLDPPANGPERGTVWAHEMGHFLGLFHATEMMAQMFPCAHDPVSDTAENDQTNVMYYTGQGGQDFSAIQSQIMRGNPMVRASGARRGTVAPPERPALPPAADLFAEALGDLDRVPPRALVEEAGGAARLRAAALDGALDTYRRERAVSLLERYASPETLSFLAALAERADAPAGVRRSALYTLAFSSREAPEAAFAVLAGWLRGDEAPMREAAARAAAWLGGARAKALLDEALAREGDAYVRSVLEARLAALR